MLSLTIGLLSSLALSPANATWVVDTTSTLHKVSPSLYGVFFEEINCAGDGGIYAELVRNRGFEDASTLDHWKVIAGAAKLVSSNPLDPASPTSLAIGPETTVENEGYWGIAAQAGESYRLSLRAFGDRGRVRAELVTPDNVLGSVEATIPPGGWHEVRTTIKSSGSHPKARLRLTFPGGGMRQIDFVSLFPERTWNRRPNGMRPDLMAMLKELRPSFVRFPGGCWVEGETMALAQRWKRTIGPLEGRRTQPNIWRYTSTNGLGYHEYLQMCEDLNADALFVINCGMSHREVVPMAEMDEFVQDALDAVEYALGPTSSKWGGLRAKLGHPKPFPLKYLQIGNENGGPAYEERYGLMYRALKAKYPGLQLIANLWGGRPQNTPIDVLDEHYYNDPSFFIANADRYDRYDRKGPKIYVGEYAVTQGNGQGSLRGALAEAAFMTGMERNSDVVVMSSYAPLFANVNNKAWNPDLIYFDAFRTVATPSYHVQRMFAQSRAATVLETRFDVMREDPEPLPPGGVGVGTWNTQAEFKDIRVTRGEAVLFESADGSRLEREAGSWTVADGALRQTSGATHARAFVGSADWSGYTLSLKARKRSGAEGFLITVGRRGERDYLWWNLGGWGNTQHALEIASGGAKRIVGARPGRIEADRWYDIRIEYGYDRIRGFLDGALLLDEQLHQLRALHGVAGVDTDGQTVVLKVVNVSDNPHSVVIDLSSTGWSLLEGTVDTLTGENADENTLDQPDKVAPRRGILGRRAPKFRYAMPPRTLAILRIRKASQ